MNAIQILTTQAWVERLGLALLHFVWQGTIIVTMYAVVRKWAARTLGPSGRYFLAGAVLTAMAIIPIVTWMLLPVQNSAAVTFNAPMSAPRAESVSTIPFQLPSQVYAAPPGHFLSWVVVFWMIGATAFALRLLCG